MLLVNVQTDAQMLTGGYRVKPQAGDQHRPPTPKPPLPGKSRGNSGAVARYPVRKVVAPCLISYENAPLLVMYSINKPEDESLRVG